MRIGTEPPLQPLPSTVLVALMGCLGCAEVGEVLNAARGTGDVVRCRVVPAPDQDLQGSLTIGVPSTGDAQGLKALGYLVNVTVGRDGFSFTAPDKTDGTGSLSLPGFSEADFTWSKQGCDEVELRAAVTVTGWVDRGGVGGVMFVDVCGSKARVDDEGHFSTAGAPSGRCLVQALGWDGDYLVSGPAQDLVLKVQETEVLNIKFPDYRVGGLGIGAVPTDGGLRITKICRSSGSYEAGMRRGDEIVAVEGQSARGWSLRELQAVAVGERGTTLSVRTKRDELETRFEVQRTNDCPESMWDAGSPSQ